MPIVSIYAIELEDATPLLVGLMVGGYALTQAIFQVPFGSLSDRIGRKRTIFLGLLIFMIGSIVSASATDIYTLLFGRLLQGAGAIGSVVSASVSDLVDESKRAKAMAFIGISIALAFSISMATGSTLGVVFGVDNLFLLTALFAIVSMVILTKVIEVPKVEIKYSSSEKFHPLKDNQILYYMFSAGVQKGVMTALFMLIPLLFVERFSWDRADLWQVYLPAMVIGLLSMPLAIIFGEKRNKPKYLFLLSSTLFIAVSLIFVYSENEKLFLGGVVLFFFAFNVIEPLIQSVVSKLSPIHQKGVALGYTNSSAYFGTFLGGLLSGLLYENLPILGAIILVLATIWLLWTFKTENPRLKGTVLLPHRNYLQQRLEREDFEFVEEWYVNRSENLIAVRYFKDSWSEDKIRSELN
jgi:predicted MFS family arabinose efflux permease